MPYDLLEIGPDPAVIGRTLPDLNEMAIREAAETLTGCAAWIAPTGVKDDLAKLTGVVDD